MDILIKGMEMPHDCDECKLCAFIPVGEYGLNRKCLPTGIKAEISIRRKDCPLIPVPPHGDLIERDKLRAKEFIHDGDAYAVVMSKDVAQAPTIIPASEGE